MRETTQQTAQQYQKSMEKGNRFDILPV